MIYVRTDDVTASVTMWGGSELPGDAPDGESDQLLPNADATDVVLLNQNRGHCTLVDGRIVADTLGRARSGRMTAIDARTRELIAKGFEFPAESGQQFSLSAAAQTNLMVMDGLRDDLAFPYPVAYGLKDDSDGVFSVVDSATAHGMYLTAVGTVRALLDGGNLLKTAVTAAGTQAELDAVVDTRA